MEESESVGSWLTDSGVLLSDSSEHSWAASPLVASPAPPEAKEEDPESAEDYSDGEEEGTNGYRSGGYHPVKIGDVFKHQYVVEKKLGWGHFSTVWLASDLTKRDDDPRKCVALKIQKSAEHYTEAAMDEIEILEKIRDTDTKSSEYVVRLLDYFSHHGPNGKHVCMVFELLGQNLLWLIKKYNYKGIPVPIVKKIARDVLMGLDYMHRSCSVIHTDLKPENILLTRDHAVDIESIRAERLAAMTPKECRRDELAAQIAEQWTENGAKPLTKNQKKKLRKKLKKELSKDQDDAPSVVLKSSSLNDTPSKSNLRGKLNRSVFAKVADFGNACWTFRHFSDEIATRQYRAPEAIVGYDYNSSVDIWAYACVIFELVTGDYLFDPKQDSKGKFSRDEDHLALMSELLGPMPKVITSQGKRSREFFLKSGELRNIKSLESWPLISVLKEKYRMQADDAESFASFLLPMLSYHPSLRASAVECLRHPWLKPTEDKKILSSNIVKNVQRTTKIQSIVSMDSPVVDANLKNTLSEDQGAELNNLEEQVEELRLDPHPLQNCAARRRCLSLG